MKQVPAYSEGNMDERTGLLIRSGLETAVNVYDLAALETALRIKETAGGTVAVFTMGPAGAESVLREAYAYGADQGVLICDRAFGGADVLATSYTLMQAIKTQGSYDLILCGKQTTDGDTAQVSGALAKWLEIPHFTEVSAVSVTGEKRFCITQTFERQKLVWDIAVPCLLAVQRHIWPVRMPSLKLRMAGKKKMITELGIDKFEDQDVGHYGLKGSATQVKRIFPPKRTSRGSVMSMEGPAAAIYILRTIEAIQGVKEEGAWS